jgi:hypothetical protein
LAQNTHATNFFVFYRINLFNLLAQNSNDNSCVFLYYMPEVRNVSSKISKSIYQVKHGN